MNDDFVVYKDTQNCNYSPKDHDPQKLYYISITCCLQPSAIPSSRQFYGQLICIIAENRAITSQVTGL